MFQEWKKYNQEEVERVHGHVYMYRHLYEGEHDKIFPRAIDLIQKGEITDNIYYGQRNARNIQTPYIIANISKVIAEMPATLVGRSIGEMKSSIKDKDVEEGKETDEDTDINEYIDVSEDGTDEQASKQEEIIEQIQKDSNLRFQHWSNVLQQQVDGGLVGVPWKDEDTIRLEFKARDVYFPHSDGKGADLVYHFELDDDKYLHVYRERVEGGDLHTINKLFSLTNNDRTEELDEDITKEILELDELDAVYKGRTRPFIIYWANAKTIMNPLGSSALKNQHSKQEEINWTLTRNALVFERNGKPRIAVSKEVMQALQDKAEERYGDDSKVDHRDLEITTFDEQGNALEVIQIDTSKIGDVQWTKDLMKVMLMETKTSEKAVDFYLNKDGGSNAESGVSKFYDLFTSLIKSEQIRDEYIYFLKDLMESALWLANYEDDEITIEEPEITINSMIPVHRQEEVNQNREAYSDGIQSLETTVRNLYPDASEEWIEEELERIESQESSDDSFSMLQGGRQNMQQMMGNKDEQGNSLDEQGNPVDGTQG